MLAALSEKWFSDERTLKLTKELEEKVQLRTPSLNEANADLKTLNADFEIAVYEVEVQTAHRKYTYFAKPNRLVNG